MNVYQRDGVHFYLELLLFIIIKNHGMPFELTWNSHLFVWVIGHCLNDDTRTGAAVSVV